MKGLVKIYDDAPPIGKIIILLMVCVLAYFLYTFLKKIAAGKPDNQNLIDNSQTELTVLQQAGEVPNYTQTQFDGWADSLYKAMEGWGTDPEAIGNVFNYMRNKADVLKLIKTFGVREYQDDGIWGINTKQMNLNEWLTTELSASDLNDYVNSKLKTQSINYTF